MVEAMDIREPGGSLCAARQEFETLSEIGKARELLIGEAGGRRKALAPDRDMRRVERKLGDGKSIDAKARAENQVVGDKSLALRGVDQELAALEAQIGDAAAEVEEGILVAPDPQGRIMRGRRLFLPGIMHEAPAPFGQE